MAAAIEEFSGNDDAITKLETTVQTSQSYDHTTQRIRDDNICAALMVEAAATVTAQGLVRL